VSGKFTSFASPGKRGPGNGAILIGARNHPTLLLGVEPRAPIPRPWRLSNAGPVVAWGPPGWSCASAASPRHR
jgi:hypothetical protein